MAPTYALQVPLRALSDLVLTQVYALPVRLLDAMRTKLVACAALVLAGSAADAASSPYLLGLGGYFDHMRILFMG